MYLQNDKTYTSKAIIFIQSLKKNQLYKKHKHMQGNNCYAVTKKEKNCTKEINTHIYAR